MPVNKSVESQAVPPAGGEVVNVDLRIPGAKHTKHRSIMKDVQEDHVYFYRGLKENIHYQTLSKFQNNCVFFMFLKQVSYAHHGWIYLIKNIKNSNIVIFFLSFYLNIF